MTILKRSEFAQQAERAVLARSGHDEGAVFAEPWEAEAFALAVKLSEQGHFTWKEWAATLADELRAAVERGENDDGCQSFAPGAMGQMSRVTCPVRGVLSGIF